MITRCHSLLFVVTRFTNRLSLVVTRCITRCITRLSFYRRSLILSAFEQVN